MCSNELFAKWEKTTEAQGSNLTPCWPGAMPRRGEVAPLPPEEARADYTSPYRILLSIGSRTFFLVSVLKKIFEQRKRVKTVFSKMSLLEKLDKIRSPKLQNQHQVNKKSVPANLANNTDRKQTAIVLSAVEGL